MTLAWLALAAALLLAGPVAARPGRHGQHAAAASSGAGRLSPRPLGALAAAATAGACVALVGPAGGVVVAGLLAPVVAAVVSRLAARPARTGPDPALPLALELAAAALRAGQTVAAALALTADVLPPERAGPWRRTAGLLALGAGPEQAWSGLGEDAALEPVAVAARRSADSGARLARTFDQLAAETRAALRAEALARANRAGVSTLLPLGLCFLPAFVCLGIVPTVVGIAGPALGVLR